ncbi:MAG: hypothetical protein AB8F95_03225 [Bacteroidia bacterium]
MRFILTLVSLLAFTCLLQSLTAQGCAPDKTPPLPDAGSPLSPDFSEINKVLASDKDSVGNFGYSVSISGDYAIVGTRRSAAYILKRDTSGSWTEVQKLLASDKTGEDNFGYTVSISGDYAIVGDYLKLEGGNGTPYRFPGVAYVFERDTSGTWVEVQKLLASDNANGNRFGKSISISGNYAIVGASTQSEGSTLANGAAYVFERDTSGNWIEVNKLLASDRANLDRFGWSVSLSGDYAIVGALRESDGGTSENGAAYVFERDTSGNWTEVNKLLASDKASGDNFGISVSLSGDYAIVGASGEDDGGMFSNGAAYIFERDASGNWTEVNKLLASDKASGDYFGISVSLSGDYAIVGARLESDGGTTYNGAAYIFERDTSGNWTEVNKLLASDKADSDLFGYSVSISGNDLLVGAYLKRDGGTRQHGAAYFFENDAGWTLPAGQYCGSNSFTLTAPTATDNCAGSLTATSADPTSFTSPGNYSVTWTFDDGNGNTTEQTQQVTLAPDNEAPLPDAGSPLPPDFTEIKKALASDKANSDNFGWSVSLSGDYAIVGAPRESDGVTSRNGAAYIFERDASGNWTEVNKLLASDKAAADDFRSSVSLSGDYAIVGASGEDDGGMFSNGAAYIFERDASGNWTEVNKLLASDKATSDFFGISVSLSGDYAIVGAYFESDGVTSQNGAAYIFERDASGNWTEVNKLLASDKATSDWFGVSVSLSGDYAIVGAPFEDDGGTSDNGAAYFFENDAGWVLPAVQDQYCGSNSFTLTAPTATDNCAGSLTATSADPTSFTSPGNYSVTWTFDDGNGNTTEQTQQVTFAPDETPPLPDAGSPLPPDFTEIKKALASDKASGDIFGSSVSLSGDYAIVGALFEDDGGTS